MSDDNNGVRARQPSGPAAHDEDRPAPGDAIRSPTSAAVSTYPDALGRVRATADDH